MDYGGEMQLVTALAKGDRTAFPSLFRKHNAAMVRLATGITGSKAVAEEVAQDAWLAVLNNIARFEGRASLASWIFAILINKARSRARVEGRSVSFDADGEDDNLAAAFDGRGRWKDMPELWDQIGADRIINGRRLLEIVMAAIEALPANQKAVMILRGQQELKPDEVCAILAISEGNMRVLLHRARLAVRAVIDQVE